MRDWWLWAGSFSEDRPLGWDPVARQGNRAGDGMACNSNDCCQWQKQGVAVGAVASRVQGSFKSRRSRWVPQPVFRVRGESYRDAANIGRVTSATQTPGRAC